jgi:hypothetical protein
MIIAAGVVVNLLSGLHDVRLIRSLKSGPRHAIPISSSGPGPFRIPRVRRDRNGDIFDFNSLFRESARLEDFLQEAFFFKFSPGH